jgi:hypothetical protein
MQRSAHVVYVEWTTLDSYAYSSLINRSGGAVRLPTPRTSFWCTGTAGEESSRKIDEHNLQSMAFALGRFSGAFSR